MSDFLNDVNQRVRERLLARVEGRFSSSDEEEIFRIARAKCGPDPKAAWNSVEEDFFATGFWGFRPKPVVKREPLQMNLGVKFILLSFVTATFGIMSVVWLGQNYASSGELKDLVLMFTAIAAVVGVYTVFLIRHRRDPDGP